MNLLSDYSAEAFFSVNIHSQFKKCLFHTTDCASLPEKNRNFTCSFIIKIKPQ